MISGTTGLLGCADGALLMQKEKRTDSKATLEVVGRDQPDQRLYLSKDQESLVWDLVHAENELWKQPPDPILEAVAKIVSADNREWEGSPTELAQAIQTDSFGAFMTICRIKQEERIKAVIHAHKQGKKASQIAPQEPQDDEEARDIENEALGVITNLIIQKTKGHGLAKIVDAILRAKGFTTYVSPAGPDKGVDILASAGTLGFGSPKICVQVKSTDAPVDRIVLDQLGGVMKNFGAEYGLLVSWSGFKSSVINETAKQFFEIRLWTHKEIIEEFLRYYDQMDDEIKELIPLKKIWVVSNDDQ